MSWGKKNRKTLKGGAQSHKKFPQKAEPSGTQWWVSLCCTAWLLIHPCRVCLCFPQEPALQDSLFLLFLIISHHKQTPLSGFVVVSSSGCPQCSVLLGVPSISLLCLVVAVSCGVRGLPASKDGHSRCELVLEEHWASEAGQKCKETIKHTNETICSWSKSKGT